jgi:transcriptional regulator with XRE-family HTH domain
MSKISYGLLDEMMTDDDKEFYKTLGERMARLRKEQQITQVQMAKLLNISQQHVASYECGRRKIPVAALPKLVKILGVSLEELLGMKSPKAKPGPVSAFSRQVEQVKLLPKSKQKVVSEMVDAMIKLHGG